MSQCHAQSLGYPTGTHCTQISLNSASTNGGDYFAGAGATIIFFITLLLVMVMMLEKKLRQPQLHAVTKHLRTPSLTHETAFYLMKLFMRAHALAHAQTQIEPDVPAFKGSLLIRGIDQRSDRYSRCSGQCCDCTCILWAIAYQQQLKKPVCVWGGGGARSRGQRLSTSSLRVLFTFLISSCTEVILTNNELHQASRTTYLHLPTFLLKSIIQ